MSTVQSEQKTRSSSTGVHHDDALRRAETGPRFKPDGAPNWTIGGTIQFLFPR